MQQRIYSIRDSKGNVYNTPFFSATHGTAERSFRELINDNQSMVHKYPDDYDLYHIGDYDDQTGCIKALDTPLHLCKAVSFK